MNIQDFEDWVARRDPQWYDQGLEAIYALREAYSLENCLAVLGKRGVYLVRDRNETR